ncbi:GGDEF domain-containing protein [Pseudolysinimonas sp.]|uniref:GGDEF domain-containing protein n=1 Tax=Pseudolysinimonas sp. TaxID=2680009 RepID=UPI00286C33C2|nr:GGDEF domain-containing protein [Pseudolysinimonas sp.]
MSVLDTTTLFLVGGLVIVGCGVTFLLETLLRHNDAVGRMWSVFYLGAMFTLFAYAVVSLDPSTWWAGPAANGAYVTALGFIWVGARLANGRRSLVFVPVAVGALVTVTALVPGETGGQWAGAVEMFLGVATVTILSAIEFARGDLPRLLASRVITVLTGGIGLYYLGRALMIALLGPDHEVFLAYFGSEASTLIEIGFAVIGTIMLSSIQNDRFAQLNEDEVEAGARLRIDGIMSARQFRQLAETWLLRAIRERTTLVLLLIDVADLEAINTAFGRAAGDAAIRTTGRIALTQAPTASLVGHLSPRRFGVLFELPANDSVETIAHRIGEGVLGAAIDDRDRFRASTYRGIATTRTSGARYGDLLVAATEAVTLEVKLALEHERDDVARES